MKKAGFTLLTVLFIAISIKQFSVLAEKLLPVVAIAKENISQVLKQPDSSCKLCGQEQVFQNYQSDPFKPERIFISKININLPVVAVKLSNGTWAVNPKVANYAEGTSLVDTRGGNVGIYAHDRADAFSEIKKLQSGDMVYVYGNGRRADYMVEQSFVIDPSSVDVFYPTQKPTLTLITCSGVFSEKRYGVKASLKNISKII